MNPQRGHPWGRGVDDVSGCTSRGNREGSTAEIISMLRCASQKLVQMRGGEWSGGESQNDCRVFILKHKKTSFLLSKEAGL